MRGSVVLPPGTGKSGARRGVRARATRRQAAKAAGADIVGMEDLAEQVKAGKMDFDVVIAAPDAMRVVGQLGQILGPRGLMPNPKVGTVTPDVAGGGQERQGAARCSSAPTRRASCSARSAALRSRRTQLRDNLAALVDALNKAKPAGNEGHLPEEGFACRARWAWRARRPGRASRRSLSAAATTLGMLRSQDRRVVKDRRGRSRTAGLNR